MEYKKALEIAERILEQLRPHCVRAEIAGSVRRKKAEGIKDIEILVIAKPYDIGLLESGIATVVNRWQRVKGRLGKDCKYTQRIISGTDGIKLDLFFADPDGTNWGYLYAIRTGSANYSRYVLARGWCKQGYKGINGYLTKNGVKVPVYEEEDLFRLIKRQWIRPELRNYDPF